MLQRKTTGAIALVEREDVALSLSNEDLAELYPEKIFNDIWAEIERAAGRAATKKLKRALGGLRVFISQKNTRRNKIAAVVGVDIANKIGSALGAGQGMPVQLPSESDLRRKRMIRLAGQFRRRGMSTRRIAKELGVNERTAWRYLAAYKNGNTSK